MPLATAPSASSTGILTQLWLSLQRHALLQFHRLAERLKPRHKNAPHLLTGERGEFEAVFFLRRLNYTVVARRWRCPELNGDLDLIGYEGGTLTFVEVKTRTARDLTPAASAVDDSKRSMLRKMARAYLRTLPSQRETPIPIRFDVVSVYLLGRTVDCELLRNAFSLYSDQQEAIPSRYGV